MIECRAVVENPMQRENLCECCGILGVKPTVACDAVSIIFDEKYEKAENLICLFEHYVRHEIKTT